MTPEEQISAFQNLSSDRKLLLDMASRLPEEVRTAMAGIIASERGLNVGGRFGTAGTPDIYNIPGWTYGSKEMGKAMAMQYSPQYKVEIKNIGLAYEAGEKFRKEHLAETTKELAQRIEKALLEDENWIKLFTEKQRPKI